MINQSPKIEERNSQPQETEWIKKDIKFFLLKSNILTNIKIDISLYSKRKGGYMFKRFFLLSCVVLLMVCFLGCKKSSEAEKAPLEAPVEETMTEESDTTAEEVPAEEAVEEAEPSE